MASASKPPGQADTSAAPESWLLLGIGVGIALAVALDSVAIGAAVGVIFVGGALLRTQQHDRDA